jgi:dTDP-4-dehydrorhamnose 3,5-epimerase
MKLELFDLTKLNNYKLITDVVVRPLKVNRDPRGFLIETLKTDWSNVFNDNLPFAQNYFSITETNVARDEDRWHIHPTKQIDRFVVARGQIVVALCDWRKDSATFGLLNLFLMGELKQDEGYYNLLVPRNVLHGFLVVSNNQAMILNYPTTLYDSKEEGRVPFNQVKVNDNETFSWNEVRKIFKLPLK